MLHKLICLLRVTLFFCPIYESYPETFQFINSADYAINKHKKHLQQNKSFFRSGIKFIQTQYGIFEARPGEWFHAKCDHAVQRDERI